MESSSNERKIVMALEAFEKDPKLTIRAASRIYEVPRTTLMERRAGKNMQILNKTFNIINEKIHVITNDDTKIFNNQLKMETNKKRIQNKCYEMELEQQFDYTKTHQDQTHFNYYQRIPRTFCIHGKKIIE